MPTDCSPAPFELAPVRNRGIPANFEGGAITSNAGALPLGATDRVIGLVQRFAACFRDARAPERVEHGLATLVGQRVFGSALGHEDLIDHDRLRHDPVLVALAGKLEARSARGAPLAGQFHFLFYFLREATHPVFKADRHAKVALLARSLLSAGQEVAAAPPAGHGGVAGGRAARAGGRCASPACAQGALLKGVGMADTWPSRTSRAVRTPSAAPPPAPARSRGLPR